MSEEKKAANLENGHIFGQRNIFWPLLLVAVGVLVLLSNLGIVSGINFFQLLRLWPVVLILFGLRIMLGGRNPPLNNLISVVFVTGVILFIIFAPTLGFEVSSRELITESFSESLDNATSARIVLDVDQGDLNIFALGDSSNLFEAEVTHMDKVEFEVSGNSDRVVRLNLDETSVNSIFDLFSFRNTGRTITINAGDVDVNSIFDIFDGLDIKVNVGLDTTTPLDLDVNLGAGGAELDLRGLIISALEAQTGSGGLNVQMPQGNFPANLSSGSGFLGVESAEDSELDLRVDVGSGRIVVTLAEGTRGNIDLDSGSGVITVRVPESLAIRISGSAGSGSAVLPQFFHRTGGSGESVFGTSGTWETENFADADADQQLFIDFSIGSGVIRLEVYTP